MLLRKFFSARIVKLVFVIGVTTQNIEGGNAIEISSLFFRQFEFRFFGKFCQVVNLWDGFIAIPNPKGLQRFFNHKVGYEQAPIISTSFED